MNSKLSIKPYLLDTVYRTPKNLLDLNKLLPWSQEMQAAFRMEWPPVFWPTTALLSAYVSNGLCRIKSEVCWKFEAFDKGVVLRIVVSKIICSPFARRQQRAACPSWRWCYFFTPLSKSLPVAFFPVQGSEPGAFPDPLRCAESGLSPGLLGGKYIVTGWLTDFQRTQSPWSNRHAVTSSFYSLGNEMSHAYDWLP